MVTKRWAVYHEFKPSGTDDPPCRGTSGARIIDTVDTAVATPLLKVLPFVQSGSGFPAQVLIKRCYPIHKKEAGFQLGGGKRSHRDLILQKAPESNGYSRDLYHAT
ncbi:hypothetical protein TNCV_1539541 [Trichonephila clavipes]|nr:hypothetical protein TNCV_1539541 [Trichonephila clavipes]